MTKRIQQIAILGAGVMGSQIAAHCINSGFKTKLYDLDESLVQKAILSLKKLKPAPLALNQYADLLEPKTYEKNLNELAECDLIIEAVAERMDIKDKLYKTIIPYLNESAILATNTSGLSLNTLRETLPDGIQSRFCGVHFFNPPRYMKLVELIPTTKTSHKTLERLETLLIKDLGKGVIHAKDTPNFIANRIGVFSLLATIFHAKKFELSFDLVDQLTGPLIGRPKSATFRTIDVVGLDTMAHVIDTMNTELTNCPWHAYYTKPNWLTLLIEKGALGQKTKIGIYKKEGKQICVLEGEVYRAVNADVSQEVKSILKSKGSDKLIQLSKSNCRQANFLAAVFFDLFHYASFHLESIASKVSDVDKALKWGFGWQQGPFEFWQSEGIELIRRELNHRHESNSLMSTAELPHWLDSAETFYNQQGSFAPSSQTFEGDPAIEVYKRQDKSESEILFESSTIKLWATQPDVCILSFKTKMNTLTSELLVSLNEALDVAESNSKALVLWQSDPMNFSCGASLEEFVTHLEKTSPDDFQAMVKLFQETTTRIKDCSIPVVAAVSGRTLGGGCEIVQHCDLVVAALESYVGLVEAGIGLLPAGGGLKALVYQAYKKAQGGDIFYFLEKAFTTVAMAKVSSSAYEAIELGLLPNDTTVIANSDELLFVAQEKAKSLIAENYKPLLPFKLPAPGLNTLARFKMMITNLQKGGFISDHDALIAEKIALVLCGGDVNEGELINESWLLSEELKAFSELGQTQKTKDRINHTLKTKRPLRN